MKHRAYKSFDELRITEAQKTVSIRRDGTMHFGRTAIQEFVATDVAYVHFYRMGGGGATRPLLSRERHELRLRGAGPFSQYGEDDPRELFRLIRFRPRGRKSYRAWLERKTQTIMVQIG